MSANYATHKLDLRGLKSIGSKYRIVRVISQALHSTGKTLLVDVFGGSGAVTMNAGFQKRVFNDANEDIVNFYRVLRDDAQRRQLLRMLRSLPQSRAEYDRYHQIYFRGGWSFASLPPVERAAAMFFKAVYSYGAKYRNGGFSVSANDRNSVKENKTYWSRLRNFAELAAFWRETVIECCDYQECIRTYGRRKNVVLYCDPPYFGTETYYSKQFQRWDHHFLSEQLNGCVAPSVVSYYEFDGMEELYSQDRWDWIEIEATKNSISQARMRRTSVEMLLVRK